MRLKRWRTALLLAAACLLLAGIGLAAAEEEAEWTVMFYFCGSDLESEYGYASGDLEEIREVFCPMDWSGISTDEEVNLKVRDIGKVNILVETGGSKVWHSAGAGIEVSPDALQRWRYNYYPEDTGKSVVAREYELMETLPLQSMGAAETLADFIRWSAKTCPARKYALVLWDHGNGAKTGLFLDKLFQDDVMYLYELRQALADGGVQLESLIIDACLMANLETAWSVKDYARWLTASEEFVPGKGSAIGDWLQALVNHPSLDGKWLGRCICDMNEIGSANEPEERDRALLTWSVTDLEKIDRLVNAFGDYVQLMIDALRSKPELIPVYLQFIYEAEEYGDGQQNMRDIGSMIYNGTLSFFADDKLQAEMAEALSDAVVYVSRGYGRSSARGLSFCYPANCPEEELDIYAKNFPFAPYLALLDAISPWTAPDSVYEEMERLPKIDTIEEYQFTTERKVLQNGIPGLAFNQNGNALKTAYYRLYQLNEEYGEVLLLGRSRCNFQLETEGTNSLEKYTGRSVLWAENLTHWPAVDGTLCCMELVRSGWPVSLYNIPVQINSEKAIMRCGRTVDEMDSSGNPLSYSYEIYGAWEGYDEDTVLMNRSVKPLAQLAGQTYWLLYARDGRGNGKKAEYRRGEEKTILRAMQVEERPLPPGTYYLEYELEDIFLRTARLERIEMHWDGERLTFPEGFTWEGTFQTQWTR